MQLAHRLLPSAAVLLALVVAAGAAAPALAEEEEAHPKVYKMTAENWKWVPDQLRIPKGTKVVLKIRSYDSSHRFDLKEYGLKVLLPQGEVTDVEFVANRVGTFKWKCGRPCGNGCPKMRGKLTVYEPEIAETD